MSVQTGAPTNGTAALSSRRNRYWLASSELLSSGRRRAAPRGATLRLVYPRLPRRRERQRRGADEEEKRVGDKPALGSAAATAAASSSSSLVLLPAVYPSGKSLIDMTASSSFTTMTAFLHDALCNALHSSCSNCLSFPREKQRL